MVNGLLVLAGMVGVLAGTQLQGINPDYKGAVLELSPRAKRIGFFLTTIAALTIIVNLIILFLQSPKGG